jgi:hypothetical protein
MATTLGEFSPVGFSLGSFLIQEEAQIVYIFRRKKLCIIFDKNGSGNIFKNSSGHHVFRKT